MRLFQGSYSQSVKLKRHILCLSSTYTVCMENGRYKEITDSYQFWNSSGEIESSYIRFQGLGIILFDPRLCPPGPCSPWDALPFLSKGSTHVLSSFFFLINKLPASRISRDWQLPFILYTLCLFVFVESFFVFFFPSWNNFLKYCVGLLWIFLDFSSLDKSYTNRSFADNPPFFLSFHWIWLRKNTPKLTRHS